MMQRIPEHPGAGRLGRHIQHDSRSWAYAFNTTGLKIQPVRHVRRIPVFDQGELGSCTGNAAVGALGTNPLFDTVPAADLTLNESYAIQIYSEATKLDDDPDCYPPIDTGSTGLAVAKALQQQAMIYGYQHTFSLGDMLKALTLSPVIVGLNWYDSFDKPTADGHIKITKGAQVRGGHEVCADEIMNNETGHFVGFTNSWSATWGANGRFYLSLDDVSRLLTEDGDVVIPIADLAPVPTPLPRPSPIVVPLPEDVELFAAVTKWAKLKALV
jgi:hypothetical protein